MRQVLGSFLLVLAACAAPASAQDFNPSLTALPRGIDSGATPEEATRLRVTDMAVAARLAGPTAEVTVEMEIATESDRPDEVRLSLLLPEGAVVTGYALGVDGRMIPGQLLEQPRAREVFEDQVRAGIDPGLAELEGNRFTTRIFPVTRTMPRRFRVSFVAPLDPERGLNLPLATLLPVGRLRVTVEAAGYASAPQVRFAGRSIALAASGATFNGELEAGDLVLGEGFYAAAGEAGPLTVARHANGDSFVAVTGATGPAPATYPPGGRLRIYWDRSLSRRDDLLDAEIALLEQLVARVRPAAIDLVTFASDQPVATTVTSSAQLRTALSEVTYRGATSFAGLDTLDLPEAAACLLFTDGRATLDLDAGFVPGCRLAIVSSTREADAARLDALAAQFGGDVIRLTAENGPQVAERLAHPAAAVVAVRDEAGRSLPFRSLAAPEGRFALVAPAPQGGSLQVELSNGDGAIVRRIFALADSIRLDSNAPGALWAAQRVGQMMDRPERHDEALDTARRFSVAGGGFSFLVLERPDQYVGAEIVPPDGFGEAWLADYRAQKAAFDQEHKRAQAQRFDFVLGEWNERLAWWKTDFKARQRRSGALRESDDDERGDNVIVTGARVSSPPPPPAPPPPPPPPPPQTANLNRLPGFAPQQTEAASEEPAAVVTGSRAADDGPVVRRQGSTELARTLSDQPYLKALDEAPERDRLARLREVERDYGRSPAFYLDTAEWFRLAGDAATSDALLLSALEADGANDETLQIVAFRLERAGAFDRAVALLERYAANATHRPQPKRQLALALAARGRARGGADGRADLERAFRLLVETALEVTENQYQGIEVIALMEANALIPAIEAAGGSWALDPKLVGAMPVDARVVIEWTADDADIDLWVDEPNGERVMYSSRLSSGGGTISNDMTSGFGPEEYLDRVAQEGTYQVRVNGFRADRINPNGMGHILVRLTRDFDGKNESTDLVDVDLAFRNGGNGDREGGARPVATLRFGRSAPQR